MTQRGEQSLTPLRFVPWQTAQGRRLIWLQPLANGALLVGERVVGEINVGCEQCDWCRQGRRAHCQHRRALGIRGKDGAFATHITLPAINLHPVPSHVPDEAAVFTEPLAAALQIRQQIAIRPKDRLVFCSGIG